MRPDSRKDSFVHNSLRSLISLRAVVAALATAVAICAVAPAAMAGTVTYGDSVALTHAHEQRPGRRDEQPHDHRGSGGRRERHLATGPAHEDVTRSWPRARPGSAASATRQLSTDTRTKARNLDSLAAGNDVTLTGNNTNAATSTGGDGNDTLAAARASHRNGTIGNDAWIGGAGNDTLNGGTTSTPTTLAAALAWPRHGDARRGRNGSGGISGEADVHQPGRRERGRDGMVRPTRSPATAASTRSSEMPAADTLAWQRRYG